MNPRFSSLGKFDGTLLCLCFCFYLPLCLCLHEKVVAAWLISVGGQRALPAGVVLQHGTS